MTVPRPRPQVMRLTDAAATRIKDVMARAEKPVAGVPGRRQEMVAAPAWNTTMEYAEAINATDEVVEDKGVKILIDPKAVLFLLGDRDGLQTEKLSAQSIFNNPNQTERLRLR